MEEAFTKDKAFLTVSEVSRIINLGRTKTYEAIRAGRIPKVVIEGCLRVPAAALRDWISARSESDGGQAQASQVQVVPAIAAPDAKPNPLVARKRARGQ
jgi:excisionase family DNA binding protein